MLLTRCVNIIICHLAMIARVCQFYCLCICVLVYLFMCVRCELCLDVVHGVSVAIKWQISYNLVMFARIEAHQSTRRRALGGGGQANDAQAEDAEGCRPFYSHRMAQTRTYWVKIILLNDQIKCLHMAAVATTEKELEKNTTGTFLQCIKIESALK